MGHPVPEPSTAANSASAQKSMALPLALPRENSRGSHSSVVQPSLQPCMCSAQCVFRLSSESVRNSILRLLHCGGTGRAQMFRRRVDTGGLRFRSVLEGYVPRPCRGGSGAGEEGPSRCRAGLVVTPCPGVGCSTPRVRTRGGRWVYGWAMGVSGAAAVFSRPKSERWGSLSAFCQSYDDHLPPQRPIPHTQRHRESCGVHRREDDSSAVGSTGDGSAEWMFPPLPAANGLDGNGPVGKLGRCQPRWAGERRPGQLVRYSSGRLLPIRVRAGHRGVPGHSHRDRHARRAPAE